MDHEAQDWFTREFEPHRLFLQRLVRRLLDSSEEAADVVQQAGLLAFSHWHQFNGRARLRTWLSQIALNEARTRLRRRRNKPEVELALLPEEGSVLKSGAASVLDKLMWRDTVKLLQAAIRSLSQHHREIVELVDFRGLSIRESAELLGANENTVKVRHARAIHQLRRRLLQRLPHLTLDAAGTA